MTERDILLNPGPVTLSDRVRDALTRADWCHREVEFASLTQSINSRLASIYEDSKGEYASVLLTGSGTLAVEAMLATFAPRGSKTLVVANGVYGERMAAMLTAMGRPMETVSTAWDAAMDLDAVEEALRGGAGISHIAAVHHETTTGRLNDIDALGELCARHDVTLLLDGVSSFGGEDIRFRSWNLKAVAGTANKCLHGVPGLSFVLAARESLESDSGDSGSVYLDLHRYYQTQHGDGYSPFTLSVQVAFALDAALDELNAQGGWSARRARYREISASLRQTLRELGVPTYISEEECSSVMCSYRLPSPGSYEDLHDRLKERGFIIYAGQGHFSDDMFRIAHMGAISDGDVDRLQQALTSYFSGT
jgi:2-aminoethylphosphonate-pyruvate transaminase